MLAGFIDESLAVEITLSPTDALTSQILHPSLISHLRDDLMCTTRAHTQFNKVLFCKHSESTIYFIASSNEVTGGNQHID